VSAARQPSQSPQPSQARQPATAYAAIARRVSSRAALGAGAAWGFAEAMLFFIVPDVWLGFVALFAPRRMLPTLAAITLGAALGAVGLYLASLAFSDVITSIIVALPGIVPSDLEQVRAELADQGAIAFLNGILVAQPVKLYIHASALDGIGLVDVVAFTLLNRTERMLVFGLVMALIGWRARPHIARWPYPAALLYVLAWIIFYAGFLVSRGA
jgi:hypothetical protein